MNMLSFATKVKLKNPITIIKFVRKKSTRTHGQIFAMKFKFYFAFENFECMQIEKGKLKMKNSTTCLKNATLFCNNSSFCVHFCPLDILD